MITLRENQEEPIRKAVEFFRKDGARPSLMVLPTAWGKSILSAYVARECGDRLLVLQPTKELLEQNIGKYRDLCGDFGAEAGIYSASFGSREIAQVTYATIGSIKELGGRFRELGFRKMLVDEAHLYPRGEDSMIGKFLKDSGIRHVLGVTATPVKLQQNYDLDGNTFSKLMMLTSRSKYGRFYEEVLHVSQVGEMVALGYWCPLRYSVAEFDRSELAFNSTKAEYTEESVRRAYAKNRVGEMVLYLLEGKNVTERDMLRQDMARRRHVLVFCPSVEEARSLSARCEGSAVVYGEMPAEERREAIRRFRSGETRVLFNVRVLNTGFDYTGIDCIIMAMSTASVALYYQMVGRATRIEPGKRDALIVDLGGNFSRFGRVEDIEYEKGRSGVWKMYGSGGVQLSGVPVHEIGKARKGGAVQLDLREALDLVMPFGKYKGMRLGEMRSKEAVEYKRWLLRNLEVAGHNERLRTALRLTTAGQ